MRIMKLVNKKALIAGVFLTIVFIGYYFVVYNRHLSTKSAINVGNDSISGIVTSKFTDCVGGEEMDAQGNIAPIKEVSCDGGSTITVDHDVTFITSTGLVPPQFAYSVDVSTIKVGDKVTVRYKKDSNGYKSLKCEDCGITQVEN